MQTYYVFLLFFILIGTTSVLAQTDPLLTVNTAEKTYEEGDAIVISGKVTTVIVGIPITIQIIHEGTIVEIAQIDVAQDGSYTHTVRTGPLWTEEGEYVVRTTYGEGNVAEASFDFFTEGTAIETKDNFEVDAGSSGTFDVKYTIRGGEVENMLIDPDIFGIVVIIRSDDDGSLTLDLPREYIDAKKPDKEDDTYIILIDGIEVPYEEPLATSDLRTLKIEFDQGDSDIEVIGTFVIPEFSNISAIILTVSIMVTIFVSLKKSSSMKIFKF